MATQGKARQRDHRIALSVKDGTMDSAIGAASFAMNQLLAEVAKAAYRQGFEAGLRRAKEVISNEER